MSRGGFTLIELMAAMVIAALAVSTAAAIFATSTDALDGLGERSLQAMRASNGREWLSDVLAGLEVTNTEEGEFEGSPKRVSFHSRVWVPSGWLEPARVAVTLEAGRLSVSALGSTVVVADSVADAEFDYLLDYGAASPWLSDWRSRANGPVAVRLRTTRSDGSADTTLFFVGAKR